MRHRPGPRDLHVALDGLMAKVQPQTALARLQRVWPAVVGEGVASHATPTALSPDGVLAVACSAAVWAQEVDLLSHELIQRLNEKLGPGTVRELRCRSTHPAPPAHGRRSARTK